MKYAKTENKCNDFALCDDFILLQQNKWNDFHNTSFDEFLPIALVAHQQSEPRLVWGEHVSDSDSYPFIVNIEHETSHRCGGAIYDEYTVISAAHCFGDDVINKKNRTHFCR